jgi:two-component system, NarL family, sensor histidine kinase DesK
LKNTQRSNPNEASEAAKAEGRSPYLLWLIWVVWLPLIIPAFIALFQSHPTLPRLIATLVGVAFFLAIYLRASWQRAHGIVAESSLPRHTEASTWLTIAVLVALSLVLTLLGGYATQGLFYYTSGYVGGSLPVRRMILVTIVITLLAIAVSLVAGIVWLNLVQIVIFIPAIVIITRTVMWSITTGWELHAAREEIARLAVTTERLRIARDLHDLLGHNLSLIALKSELARRLIAVSPERAAVEIGDVESVARTTLQEVREAVAAYRQPALVSELRGAQEILTAAGIVYLYEGDDSMIDVLSPAVEAVLSWTVREGVTNVIRHSRAHQCTIRVTWEKQTIRVEVIDDGGGCISGAGGDNGGNGLRGLAERVAVLGGRCEAHPGPGGFHLSVSVPLAQGNHDAGTPGTSATSPAQRLPLAASERINRSSERREQL